MDIINPDTNMWEAAVAVARAGWLFTQTIWILGFVVIGPPALVCWLGIWWMERKDRNKDPDIL